MIDKSMPHKNSVQNARNTITDKMKSKTHGSHYYQSKIIIIMKFQCNNELYLTTILYGLLSQFSNYCCSSKIILYFIINAFYSLLNVFQFRIYNRSLGPKTLYHR